MRRLLDPRVALGALGALLVVGALALVGVAAGSPAAEAGLRGDRGFTAGAAGRGGK
ncbi:MAG: hypothetical protein M3370_03595 [Actinomycetota bacterium]|nr:hypothetical protein [Actinomycetota bacterium]